MKMTKGEHLFTLMTMRLSGELTPGEAEELDHLIATDPAVKARWMELCRTFSPSDIANHFERLNEPKLPRRRAPRTLRFVLAAAAAAMVSGLVWWVATPVFRNREIARKNEAPLPGGVVLSTASGQTVNLSHPSSATLSGWQATTSAQTLNITTADDAAGWNRLSVPPGLTYRVILPDGSKIWLNSATSLQFPGTFPPTERRVRLQGEAWMEIAPDPSKIFIVETDSMEVTVLGTTFNLKAYESGAAELSLVNGAVKAASMGKQLTLRPGQQAFLHNGSLNTRLFDVPEIAAWRDGKYYFEQIPLTEIAAILQRAYNLETVFDDQNIAAQTFTGLLNQHKPVGTFLENLQSTTAVQYYFDNSGKLHLH